jgi:hypothetical protein
MPISEKSRFSPTPALQSCLNQQEMFDMLAHPDIRIGFPVTKYVPRLSQNKQQADELPSGIHCIALRTPVSARLAPWPHPHTKGDCERNERHIHGTCLFAVGHSRFFTTCGSGTLVDTRSKTKQATSQD